MFKNKNQFIIQDQISEDSKILTSNKKETEGDKKPQFLFWVIFFPTRT